MRRLLKIIDKLARPIAVIDIGKTDQRAPGLQKSSQQHKKRNATNWFLSDCAFFWWSLQDNLNMLTEIIMFQMDPNNYYL